jgi:hypothetical protein
MATTIVERGIIEDSIVDNKATKNAFIQRVKSDPDDSEIYEDLPPEVEDNLIRTLSFASGAWNE